MSLPATDNFNRTDAATLGSNWTAQDIALTGATCKVVSNQCSGPTNRDFAADYWNADSFNNDQYSQAVAATPGSNADYIYVIVRASSSGATANHYSLTVNTQFGTSFIQKIVAGSASTIATLGVAFGTTDKLKIDVVGTTVTAYKDSGSGFVSIGNVTDSSLASGSAGVRMGQVTVSIMDNWEGGNVGAGAGGVFTPFFFHRHVGGQS